MSRKSVFEQHPWLDQRWEDWARDIERLLEEQGWNVRGALADAPQVRVQLRNDLHADPVGQEATRRDEAMDRVYLMHRVFSAFPQSWRTALVLHYLCGKGPGQIAEELEIDHRQVSGLFSLIFRETKLQLRIERRTKIVQGDEMKVAAIPVINPDNGRVRAERRCA